jgi:mannose-6-phosphate isomerase-like protein (cupin superfamily)
MDAPEVIRPGEGELVGDAPDRRLEILCEDDAVHATSSRFAAGRDGADLHVHRRHTDVFSVLEGEPTVRLAVDDASVVVPAGTRALGPASEARHRHVQSFYVLDGEIAVTTGERELGAPAGSRVQVPPGAANRIAFPQAARLLDLRTPAAP